MSDLPATKGGGAPAPALAASPAMTLGLIGVGAFGAFCLPHLAPHFRIFAYDRTRDLDALAAAHGVTVADLATAAGQDVVVLAMPVRQIEAVAEAVRGHLRPGCLVLDVCSLKVRPVEVLTRVLPADVDVVSLHPLFGPQSGRDGIAGLRVAVCPGRGSRTGCVEAFLRERLALNVIATTPERHDQEMAYVQGLTHLISKMVVAMQVPPMQLKTETFEHLMRMVETVRYDSDALFRTIAQDNPYVAEVKQRFFAAAGEVQQALLALQSEAA